VTVRVIGAQGKKKSQGPSYLRRPEVERGWKRREGRRSAFNSIKGKGKNTEADEGKERNIGKANRSEFLNKKAEPGTT